MSDFLSGLVGVKNNTNRVSDSVDARRKRILDAKRRMAVKRDGTASSINRVSDSARPSTRGTAVKRASAVQGLTRKQDSASKIYMRRRQRIKDELAETETTEEAVEAVMEVLNAEVEENPEEVLNAAEDIVSAVLETVGDLLPEGGEDAGDGAGDGAGEPEGDEPEDDEVADSVQRRVVVRRKSVADARAKRAEVRPSRRAVVKDSEARKRALAAARRVRDARAKRAEVRSSRRAADSRMQRNVIRHRG